MSTESETVFLEKRKTVVSLSQTTACMKSWYDLEGVIKTTMEYIREGVVRQPVPLKDCIKNSKSMLEEVSSFLPR